MYTPCAVRVFAFGAFLLSAHPSQAQQEAEWTWKDRGGKTHTRAELHEILRKHEQWVESKGKSGSRADLWRADLRWAPLREADLDGADMHSADLSDADLRGAHLEHADLYGATLTLADLDGAYLKRVDLGVAQISRANLHLADLNGANLNSAHLEGAFLQLADVSGAVLTYAQLRNANLLGADLRRADLSVADLNGANLISTDLTNAYLLKADLARTIFEPKSLPELRGVAAASNLELLTYDANPDALVQLRKQLEDSGFREEERKITYALKRREAEISWEGCKSRKTGDRTRAILWSSDSNLANCGSFILNRVFFDWTCQYGMSPGRPLSLGVLVWALCSILYFVCIRASGQAGLYRVYAQGVDEDPSGHRRVERISLPSIGERRGVRRLLQFIRREYTVLRASMFFSLMSAFNIGFRDINFGRWLRLLTRQEFDIKAVGWARVVAGWQSLLSVYLIALWVLTYFGRPFR